MFISSIRDGNESKFEGGCTSLFFQKKKNENGIKAYMLFVVDLNVS